MLKKTKIKKKRFGGPAKCRLGLDDGLGEKGRRRGRMREVEELKDTDFNPTRVNLENDKVGALLPWLA